MEKAKINLSLSQEGETSIEVSGKGFDINYLLASVILDLAKNNNFTLDEYMCMLKDDCKGLEQSRIIHSRLNDLRDSLSSATPEKAMEAIIKALSK